MVKTYSALCSSVITIFIGLVLYGCTNDEDYTNPLDPKNLRTAGSPPGLNLTPGDQQVTVSWRELNSRIAKDIKGYRIYRRFTEDENENFEPVPLFDKNNNSLDLIPANQSTYIDKHELKNDQISATTGDQLYYEYRISYIDDRGIEIPNPTDPPRQNEEPPRVWTTRKTTPSNPPPAPNIILGKKENLIVTIIWPDYNPPPDFKEFRIFYTTPTRNIFIEIPELDSDTRFYRDTSFKRDGEEKTYRVIAYDKFGVASVATIKVKAPDVSPASPRNVKAQYQMRSLFSNRYNVALTWTRNQEPDLAGYWVYSTKQGGGNPTRRRKVDGKFNSVVLEGEDFILDLETQDLVPRQYFLTAFDDSPNSNGKIDESEKVPVPLPDAGE